MPSVLLIADRPGWAYDILAKVLQRQLAGWVTSIRYIVDIRRNIKAADFSSYDVVFFFFWFDGMKYGPYIKGFRYENTCVGVHSLASWDKRDLSAGDAAAICNRFAATGVISEQLRQTLVLERPFLTPNGVDADLFSPTPPPSFQRLKFMWVGNPSVDHHGDNKGFESIILPVFEPLLDRVDLVTATPKSPVARTDMGKFYAAGHILVCMSESEGGPLPVVEAMHAGRPVISTPVGVVPEIVEPGVNGWIIERSQAALRDQIQAIVNNPACLTNMWSAAHAAVKDRNGTGMAASYDKMFRSAL